MSYISNPTLAICSWRTWTDSLTQYSWPHISESVHSFNSIVFSILLYFQSYCISLVIQTHNHFLSPILNKNSLTTLPSGHSLFSALQLVNSSLTNRSIQKHWHHLHQPTCFDSHALYLLSCCCCVSVFLSNYALDSILSHLWYYFLLLLIIFFSLSVCHNHTYCISNYKKSSWPPSLPAGTKCI